jgi:hypothetical protein
MAPSNQFLAGRMTRDPKAGRDAELRLTHYVLAAPPGDATPCIWTANCPFHTSTRLTREGALFLGKVRRVCPRHSGETAIRIGSAPSDGRTEGAMRVHVEAIVMIFGLPGAYFALLPLTI